MTRLYVSTDVEETGELLKIPYDVIPFENYQDLSIKEGESLRARIGFNPMCVVTLSDSLSDRQRAQIIARLSQQRLFFALESGTTPAIHKNVGPLIFERYFFTLEDGTFAEHTQEQPIDEVLLRLHLATKGSYQFGKSHFLFHFATHPNPQLGFNYYPRRR